jgi:cell division protein FtsB
MLYSQKTAKIIHHNINHNPIVNSAKTQDEAQINSSEEKTEKLMEEMNDLENNEDEIDSMIEELEELTF